MTKKYYSAQVVEDTISILENDLRNLRSQTLKPYYESDSELSDDALSTKAGESREFRLANGIKTIPTSELVAQIAQTNNRSLFIRLLVASGIELEFVEDLVAEAIGDQLPQLGDVTSFAHSAAAHGTSLSIADIRAKLDVLDIARTAIADADATVYHVLEDAPIAVATEVVEVSQKLDKMHNYVRAWFR
jgi:hypothetical protein